MTKKPDPLVKEPNQGPQTEFLETSADVAFYGGKPGGGKTIGLFLEFLGNKDNPLFRALILRRIGEDLREVGGAWDSSKTFYEGLEFKANENKLTHVTPAGAVLGFSSMRDAHKDHLRFKSVENDLIMFEELPEFERHQFWYMFSRNRGKSGIRPYIRATMNPQAGWVYTFLNHAGYVDDDGFAIQAMSGVIRWFYRDDATDNEMWFDSRREALDNIEARGLEDVVPTSFTFILSSAKDNPYQTEDYISKLSNLSRLDRARLKDGNWKIESEEGGMFKGAWWIRTLRPPPMKSFKAFVRSWDLAHTDKPKDGVEKKKKSEPAFTAGVLMGITHDNHLYIFDVTKFQKSTLGVRTTIKAKAMADEADYPRPHITLPMDPSAGKANYDNLKAHLVGHIVKPMDTIGSKMVRAEAFSAAVENQLVHLVVGPWTDDFVNEGKTFPNSKFKDQLDAASDAFDYLTGRSRKKFDRSKWTS